MYMIKGHDESRELSKIGDKSWKKIGEKSRKKRALTLPKGRKEWHDNDEKKMKMKISSLAIKKKNSGRFF